jgi:hypothetical protein
VEWTNLIGLAINIIGASLMYFNTPYPIEKPKSSSGSETINQSANWLLIGKHKERKQLRLVRLGFGCLMVGSSLQFIAATLFVFY